MEKHKQALEWNGWMEYLSLSGRSNTSAHLLLFSSRRSRRASKSLSEALVTHFRTTTTKAKAM